MDHSDNDKRFCVYAHCDGHDIVYIGSGNLKRPYSTSNRSKEHLDVFKQLTVKILVKNLSKAESLDIEQQYIDKFYPTRFNKSRVVSKPNEVLYDNISNILYYDETSPSCIRWKNTFYAGSNLRIANDIAGYIIKDKNYFYVFIDGYRYPVHRLVWSLCNKVDVPTNLVVDHADRDGLNNKIANLRLVTHTDNQRNQSVRQDSVTGVKGVIDKGKRFCAEITVERGSRISKSFSINLFSDDPKIARERAFAFACLYRDALANVFYFKNDVYYNMQILSGIDIYLDMLKHNPMNRINWNNKLSKWYVTWDVNGVTRSKCFNPATMFKGLCFDLAKEKALQAAIQFKQSLSN